MALEIGLWIWGVEFKGKWLDGEGWEAFSFVKCLIYPCFLPFVNVRLGESLLSQGLNHDQGKNVFRVEQIR